MSDLTIKAIKGSYDTEVSTKQQIKNIKIMEKNLLLAQQVYTFVKILLLKY